MSALVPLPAHTDAAALALRAVAAAAHAAMRSADVAGRAQLDPERVAVAYSSERWLRIDGKPQAAFAPLSGFFRTRDGWVRTHANYLHHRDAFLVGLSLPPTAERVDAADALAALSTDAATTAITARGGLCVPVRPEAPDVDAALRSRDLVTVRRIGGARTRAFPHDRAHSGAHAPLAGIRVLDLTRVIAGPIATRTLGLLGAEVLRIDPPQRPELANQHLDTGHGKRSAQLDLASPAGRARFEVLLDRADVLALGYRPAALARLGLEPAMLAQRHPGLVVLRLTAWGEPDRRGFDSLVQAESGIALIEGEPDQPGALPAQALDHSAGYLLAAAAMDLLDRRAREGGTWLAETSLRRIAAELLGMPRSASPEPGTRLESATGHTQTFLVEGHKVTTAAPAFSYPGGPTGFAAPRPWGQDEPAWL